MLELLQWHCPGAFSCFVFSYELTLWYSWRITFKNTGLNSQGLSSVDSCYAWGNFVGYSERSTINPQLCYYCPFPGVLVRINRKPISLLLGIVIKKHKAEYWLNMCSWLSFPHLNKKICSGHLINLAHNKHGQHYDNKKNTKALNGKN